MTAEQEKRLFTQLGEIASAVKTAAIGVRSLTPKAAYVTGPASFVIPANTKSFNIINLGFAGGNQEFTSVTVAGIPGITAILAPLKEFGYSVENDQDILSSSTISVTPAANHIVLIQYLV